MKNFLTLVAVALVAASCAGGYSVNGTIATDALDGHTVYIKCGATGDARVVDSCRVEKGSFKLSGKADSAFLVTFYIDDTPVFPFVAEKGSLEINIQETSVSIEGSPLNDELNNLMQQMALLEGRMRELERRETALILDGSTAEAAQAFVSDSIEAVGESMERLMNGFIRKNFDNVLAPCVFALMYSAVPVPLMNSELESLYNDAPQAFRNDAFVKKFYDIARENVRRLERGAFE